MNPTIPPRHYICRYCGWDMITNSNVEYHQRVCLLSDKRSQEICKICAKKFNTSEELKFHLKKCGKYQCYKYDLPFLTATALNSHIISYHHNSDNINTRIYVYSQCKKNCTSRRDLYNHRMNQHGGMMTMILMILQTISRMKKMKTFERFISPIGII